MSKYTTEVRFICETNAGLTDSTGYTNIEKILTDSINNIFDFDFPIFDEDYRGVLERKILKHYYTREIAFETVGLWKLKLATKLNEIMPYYNKLYESETYKFNPLYDVDYTRTGSKDGSGKNETNNTDKISRNDSASNDTNIKINDNTIGNITTHSDTDSVGWNLFNDTPQGGLVGVEDLQYLTTATKNTNDSDTDSTENRSNSTETTSENKSNTISNSTEDSSRRSVQDIINSEEYAEHVAGKMGTRSYASLIKEYRENLLNIDMMVIDEIKDLFIMLW